MNRTRPRRSPARPRRSTHRGKCPTSGKARYGNPGDAWAAAVRVSSKVGPLRAYLCPACQGGHLTRLKIWKDQA